MHIYKFSRKSLQREKGFTLIEAMIAVVVFSFGLLGVAGVMIVSVKNNHNGYMRSQATFLAHSMIEMMRKNSWSLWNNTYNGTFGHPATFVSLATTCDAGSPCNATGVANRDTQLWANMLLQTLPQGAGTINCVQTGAAPIAVAWNKVDRPYLGICTVTVFWNESNSSNAVDAQSIVVQANP